MQATSITTTSTTIAWQANVIGLGKVAYGTSSLGQVAQDAFNLTDHAIALSGLAPGTTYQFRASNTHAIDGDDLAAQTGQFTTASDQITLVITEPNATPRVINVGQGSVVSIRAKNGGTPVAGATIGFAIDPASAGGGSLSAAQVQTDGSGIASVQFTASRRGLVHIDVYPPAPSVTSHTIPIVVR